MDAGIQPRKRNGCRQQKGQKTGFMVEEVQRRSCRKRAERVTGRKRPRVLRNEQRRQVGVGDKWTRSHDKVLEEHVAKQKADAERDQHRRTGAACSPEEQQQYGKRNPDSTVAAHQGEHLPDCVGQTTAPVLRDVRENAVVN